MEISLQEIEELFKGAVCHYQNLGSKSMQSFVLGDPRKIGIYKSCDMHIKRDSLAITQLDLSSLSLVQKLKISELFEAHIKGELTIR